MVECLNVIELFNRLSSISFDLDVVVVPLKKIRKLDEHRSGIFRFPPLSC